VQNYQHLFYLLQTEPKYLASLIYQLKTNDRVQKFMETVVLTLFGYAQNDRDEYLLLSLFRVSLPHFSPCLNIDKTLFDFEPK